VLGSICAIAVIVISITQITPNSASGKQTLDCNNGNYASYRPSKFRHIINATIDGNNEFFKCPWHPTNTFTRIGFGLFAIIIAITGIIGLFKSKKWLLYALIFFAPGISVTFFIIMSWDANSIRISSDWCEKGLGGEYPIKEIDCSYFEFIQTCIVDSVVFIIWLPIGFLAYFYTKKHMVEIKYGEEDVDPLDSQSLMKDEYD